MAQQVHGEVVPQGDRGLSITQTVNAPVSAVFAAWSDASLFRRWWFPKSVSGVSLVGCDIDMRPGGKYRLEFSTGGDETMAFFGRYLEVVPEARIVWTNDEGEDGAVTTVTFADEGGATRLTYAETYPTAAARDEALATSAAALPEQFGQLAELLRG